MTVKAPGRPPGSDGELVRDFHDRLSRLENRRTMRVGSWVLSDIDGSLVATKPGDVVGIAGAAVAEAVKVDLGDLSQYVSHKDLDDVLKNFAGAVTGVATAPVGSNPLFLQIQQWAAGLGGGADIGGIVEAITGTIGDLADLANWALAIPAGVINGVLTAANIPGLDAAKIITGQFAQSMVNITSIAGNLITGALTNIAVVPANIVAGALTSANIPGLDLSKITSGFATGISSWLGSGGALPGATTLGATSLTGLATGIGTWLTAAGAIPAAATLQGSQLLGSVASSLLSGTIGGGLIPNLDLSKITTGFGTGIAAWLGSGGALPGATSLLGSQVSGITAIEQTIVNQINAAVGQAAGQAATTVQAALQNFPPANVLGQFGTTLQADLSNLVGGMVTAAAGVGVPTSLGALNAALGGIANLLGYRSAGSPPASSTTGITTTNNSFIAQLAGTKPSSAAIDPTADVTFNLSQIVGSSATTVPITQAVSAIGAIGIQFGGVAGTSTSLWPLKKSVCWLGSGPTTTTITAMWVNIWRINTANGTKTIVHTSPELISTQGVATTLAWNYYNIPNSVDFIPVQQGDWFAAEICLMGSGTYNIVGMPSNWMPAHPSVFPKAIGATRVPAALDATIANVAGNGGSNNSKSGVGTIDIVATVEANATCVVGYAAAGGAAAAGTFTAQMVTGSRSMPQQAVRQVSTANAFSNLYCFALFFRDANGKPCRAVDIGVSGSQTFRLSQTAAIGTWNASWAVQSFVGPTSAGTAVTNSGISTVPSVTQPTAQRKAFVAVGFAGFGTMSGVTNWNNIAAGNLNAAGTFPLITGYANGPTASTAYSTTMSNTNWGGIALPLLIDATTATALAALPTPNAIAAAGNAIKYSSNIPWLGLTGSAGVSQYPPDTQQITTVGLSSYIKPVWANYFDIIVCGGGGAGQNGAAFTAGVAGYPGGWTGVTLAATDPDIAAVSTFDVYVGPVSGGNGNASYVNINSVQKAYGYGGAGGVGYVAGGYGGNGPGSSGYTQNGVSYPGGGTVGPQAWGSFPGGGGGGGNSASYGGSGPGAGQQGVVYIVARQ